jgi:hypothetical protein
MITMMEYNSVFKGVKWLWSYLEWQMISKLNALLQEIYAKW